METKVDSVWDVLSDTPGEALNLSIRSHLMRKISRAVKSWGLSQQEAANRMVITQPRLNDLLTGKIDKFSLDALVLLLEPAGLKINIQVG